MTPFYDDGRVVVYVGHVLDVLAGLEAGSVDGTLLRYDPARPVAAWVRECNAQGRLR